MPGLINDNFILKNEKGKYLYDTYAKDLPIIDYHCHINPCEIFEDKQYDNITQMWLYGDHYKWRLMRTCGIDEKYITGDGSDHDKFIKFAEALELSIGNPIYHWSHLELKKYFGYEGILNSRTAETVWEETCRVIKEKGMSVRSIIDASNVEVICTTDDPVDDLKYHSAIKEEGQLKTKVFPAWRPDKAVNIEKTDFPEYMNKLAKASGIEITDLESLKKALVTRMEYFSAKGCSVSDHGLDYVPFVECSDEEADRILKAALSGVAPDEQEAEMFKTNMMVFFAAEYRKMDWVMQLHYGCERNINKIQFGKLGPDTGYDCISDYAPSSKLSGFLNCVENNSGLPKTIVYSLNPEDNAVIDTIIGGFMESGICGKLQHGSAWWFNDHKQGMEEQMISLANRGVLGLFIGMLTDSRSFLSYTRHDYFRRILCNLIGKWVEDGEYPWDEEALERIVKGICHDNAVRYFGF